MKQAEIVGALESFRKIFNCSTSVLTEEHSNFAPKPEMFTVAGQVAHAAQTVDWFLKGAFAAEGFDMNFEKMDGEVRGCKSLTAARKWLDEAIERAIATAKSHTDAEWAVALPAGPIMGGEPRYCVIGALSDHTAHHRGALTVYSRLLGLVPPMPYM